MGQTISGALGRVGFSPLGLGLLVTIAILPLVPPFNQQHIIRWLIAGAFLDRARQRWQTLVARHVDPPLDAAAAHQLQRYLEANC